ncbi:MAG: hypothetical protein JST29_08440 [Bacteroidetes bacterium]|nr:hypothetical protein [Bacteroidota bacterium]
MDKFKQYIQQHKTELNTKEPSANLWLNIQQQLPTKKSATVLTIFKWAAAACIIVLCGFGVLYLLNINKQNNNVAVNKNQQTNQPIEIQKETTPQENLENNNPQIAQANAATNSTSTEKNKQPASTQTQKKNNNNNEVETTLQSLDSRFINIINLQKEKISSTPLYTESPSYYSDFIVRFKEMDSDEKAIKNAITKQGLTDDLLSRLINVYQQKLNVLKDLQKEINKTNNRYMQNHQPSNNTNKPTFIHFNNI